MPFKSKVDPEALKALNEDVKKREHVDREHLLHFLSLIPTNEAEHIILEVKNWLQQLHDDPKFEKITFPRNRIDAIIGDLDSYGRVQASTIYNFKSKNRDGVS